MTQVGRGGAWGTEQVHTYGLPGSARPWPVSRLEPALAPSCNPQALRQASPTHLSNLWMPLLVETLHWLRSGNSSFSLEPLS